MSRPTCETCPHWDKYGASHAPVTGGACRIKPIHVNKDSDSWCGQHPDFPAWPEAQRVESANDSLARAVDARLDRMERDDGSPAAEKVLTVSEVKALAERHGWCPVPGGFACDACGFSGTSGAPGEPCHTGRGCGGTYRRVVPDPPEEPEVPGQVRIRLPFGRDVIRDQSGVAVPAVLEVPVCGGGAHFFDRSDETDIGGRPVYYSRPHRDPGYTPDDVARLVDAARKARPWTMSPECDLFEDALSPFDGVGKGGASDAQR